MTVELCAQLDAVIAAAIEAGCPADAAQYVTFKVAEAGHVVFRPDHPNASRYKQDGVARSAAELDADGFTHDTDLQEKVRH